MALPGRSRLAPRSLHDTYQLKWAAGNQGGRCSGTRTPDAGPKQGPKEAPFGLRTRHSGQSRTTPRLPVVGSRPSWAL